MKEKKLTHLDEKGKAKMVDVSQKNETERVARATAKVLMSAETLKLILEGKVPKGDVLTASRLAGISAAKKTSDLIPLCHPLRLTNIEIKIEALPGENVLGIISTVRAVDRTGVEMEALTAVTVAALTIYDMCKAVDKRMVITDIHLEEKRGGKSGEFKW